METDPRFAQYQIERPEQTAGPSAVEQYMDQPIKRLFDPNKYIDGMANTTAQSDKEYNWLSTLGYGLQLGNPNFNPMTHLKDYKANQLRVAQGQWDQLQKTDQLMVERESVKRLSVLDPDTAEGAAQHLSDWGVLNIDIRKRILDDWGLAQPDKPESSILTSKEFTVDSLRQYAASGDPTVLRYVGGRREAKAFDRMQKFAALTNTERDQLEGFVKVPIAKIRETQEAYQKVMAVAVSDKLASADMDIAKADLEAINKKRIEEGKEPIKASSQGIRDIARINAYQRLIDPATVREGDVALARSATSWAGWLNILKDRIAEGAFLDDTMRSTMDDVARRFYLAQINSFYPDILDAKDNISERYTGRYGLEQADADLDFESVVGKRNMKDWNALYQEFLAEDDAAGIYVPEDEEEEEVPPNIEDMR